MTSGRIFEKTKLSIIEDKSKPYTTNVCPVCEHRVLYGNYTPCTQFQSVEVDVTSRPASGSMRH
jgi:hypothetical protein